MSIAAGKLRHRVEIQEPVISRNTFGEREEVWAHFAYAWASVEPLSAKEFTIAQQTQSKVSARITIRHREGISAIMRVLFRGKAYNIEGILTDKDSGIEYITLPVSEGIVDPSPSVTVIDGGSP